MINSHFLIIVYLFTQKCKLVCTERLIKLLKAYLINSRSQSFYVGLLFQYNLGVKSYLFPKVAKENVHFRFQHFLLKLLYTSLGWLITLEDD